MPAEERPASRPVIEAATLSERAATLVEQDILAGHLAPGSRLGIVDLVQRDEIGATPLREGLSRLMSRGLIVGIGQRGFRVRARCRCRGLRWSGRSRCPPPAPIFSPACGSA